MRPRAGAALLLLCLLQPQGVRGRRGRGVGAGARKASAPSWSGEAGPELGARLRAAGVLGHGPQSHFPAGRSAFLLAALWIIPHEKERSAGKRLHGA
jgi:hypothetical protein